MTATSEAGSSTPAADSFTRRVARVLMLDRDVYAEVERDPHGLRQAATVVAVVALAAVLATVARDSWHAGAMVGAVAAALIHWLLWSILVFLVASVLFKAPTNRAAVVRALGFAQAPQVIAVLGFVPVVGPVVVIVSRVLAFIAGHRAMIVTLRLKGWRLMATTLLSFLVTFAVAAAVRAVLGDMPFVEAALRG